MKIRMVGIAAAAMASAAVAMAADTTTEDLKAQIQSLQTKLSALEARQNAADEAASQRVLADAQNRSQLMASEGFTSGYSKGKFIIQSADGSFSFSPSLQLQVRYAGNYREDNGSGDSTYSDGFELRRAKFGFNGNAVSPSLTYKFVWGTDRSGKGVNLEEGWVRNKFDNGVFVFGGQFEDLTTHESIVSSSKQLAVEQSLVNKSLIDNFSEYAQGAGVGYETKKARVSVALTDGWGATNTGYTDQAIGATTIYWGASARGEVMVIGDNWKGYDDFSAVGNTADNDLLVLGGGASYAEGTEFRGVVGGVDAQWEPAAIAGLSTYGGLLTHFADNRGGAEDTTDWGFVLQAGYMLNSKCEVFGRFDQLRVDATGNTFHEYTAGVNYYVAGHNAKFTVDIGYLPDGAPASESGLAVQASDDAEWVGRAQFQLAL